MGVLATVVAKEEHMGILAMLKGKKSSAAEDDAELADVASSEHIPFLRRSTPSSCDEMDLEDEDAESSDVASASTYRSASVLSTGTDNQWDSEGWDMVETSSSGSSISWSPSDDEL